jgi:hypothetical protein
MGGMSLRKTKFGDIPVDDEQVPITFDASGKVIQWGPPKTDLVSKSKLVEDIDDHMRRYAETLKDIPKDASEYEVLDSMYILLKFWKIRILDGEFDTEELL